MAQVRNISTGPRGARLDGKLVMVDPGKTADADDFAPEWFEEVGAAATEHDDSPAMREDITAAIGLLDATNDDHWTSAGLPAVDAVAELAGKRVTRAAIHAAAPDAKRPEVD